MNNYYSYLYHKDIYDVIKGREYVSLCDVITEICCFFVVTISKEVNIIRVFVVSPNSTNCSGLQGHFSSKLDTAFVQKVPATYIFQSLHLVYSV